MSNPQPSARTPTSSPASNSSGSAFKPLRLTVSPASADLRRAQDFCAFERRVGLFSPAGSAEHLRPIGASRRGLGATAVHRQQVDGPAVRLVRRGDVPLTCEPFGQRQKCAPLFTTVI